MSRKSTLDSNKNSSRKLTQKVKFKEYDVKDFTNSKITGKPPVVPNSTSVPSIFQSSSSLGSLQKENLCQKFSNRRVGSLERQSSKHLSNKRQSDNLSGLRSCESLKSDSGDKRTRSSSKILSSNELSLCSSKGTRQANELIESNGSIYKCKSLDGRNLYSEKNRREYRNNKLILTQNCINKSSKNSNNTLSKAHQFSRSIGDWSQQCKRSVSQSPSRNYKKECEDESNKENGKSNHKKRDQSIDKTLKEEYSCGKPLKQDVFWKFEKDAMWTYNSNGGKRAGYLLFTCAFLEEQIKETVAEKHQMTFKFSQADSKLIRILMECHGLKEVTSSNSLFNLFWGNSHFSPNEIRPLQEWQKINHFPRSSELTRKDRLYMNIKRMQRQCGVKLFDFIPMSFVLPTEYREFCDTHLRERGTWIVKPVASSQGKGIYIASQVDQVSADETSLVCRYLESPLLVNGYKCDLRLYVLVTSLDPLVVYLYEEGLVRLATIKYQIGKNLWNPCIHLTNYSLNKFHSDYVQNEDPEIDDQGNKWSLSAFLRHLKARGADTGALMRSIEDVIIKSILSAAYQMNTATNMFVPHSRNCFELFGFDVLIDSELKPWVLEVNLSPSLNVDQPLDLKIKSAMLADLFSLIGVQVHNPNTARVSARPSVYRKLPNLRHSSDTFDRCSQPGSSFGSSSSSGFLSPSQEELRLFRQLREEYERRGGWARIFPTPDSWAMYGSLQEYSSPLNLIFHLHLFPHVPRNNRYYRVSPLKASCVSSSGLASSLERLNCYERALLPNVYSFLRSKFGSGMKNKEEKKFGSKDVVQLKASLLNALENGLTLSKYQARMAFSVYLQHIQRRLMIGCDQEKQTDLVYRFLRSATRTLQLPFSVQVPSKTLPQEARAIVISKQLGDFIQAYTKETQLCMDSLQTSGSCSSLSSQCHSSATSTTLDSSQYSTVYSLSTPAAAAAASTSSFSSKDADTSVSFLMVNEVQNGRGKELSRDATSGSLSESDLADSTSVSLPSIPSTSSVSSSSSSACNLPPSSAAPVCSLHKPTSSSIPTHQSSSNRKKQHFHNRIMKFRSEEGNNISSIGDDEGYSRNEDPPSAVEQISNSRSRKQQEQDAEGIAMELYRTFLSNAGESDLEEVLTLQARIHDSAGVFLDPARRSRTPHSSDSAAPPRIAAVPSPSPQGSPRKSAPKTMSGQRAKSSQIETTQISEPVTNEPSFSCSNPEGRRPATVPSVPVIGVVPSSTCCLFGNILKASLKGTKVHF